MRSHRLRGPRPGSSTWFGIVALGAVLLAGGCGSADSLVRDTGHRAVVIGIDGADWKLIDALAADGDLPNLSRLRSLGASGPIATLSDIPLSPVIWTSVATGKSATKHGVAWFMVDRADGTRAPVRSYNRQTRAIWNILHEHGKRPGVVGWWATYPAENVGDGIIVSDALGFHGFGSTARDGDDSGKTYPEHLYTAVRELMPDEGDVNADFARRFIHIDADAYLRERYDPEGGGRRDPQNPIHLFQQYAVTADGYTAIAERLLDEETFDLLMVYFEQVDSFSHLFMKYAPPRLEWVDDAGFERYRDVVTEWYRWQDRLLGRLLDRIDLETTAVFVLSDHGFKSGERRIRSEQTVDVRRAHLDHETDGIFIAAGPDIRAGAEIVGASVLDVTPTVLHYLGFPVGRDMDGRVLKQLFEPQFRDAHPVRHIDTYESSGAPMVHVADPPDGDLDPAALDERMRTLEALGYVGGAPPPTAPAPQPIDGESSPEIHNNLGRSHLAAGRTAEARREFEEALRLDPHSAEALLNLGMLSRLDGRVTEAERLVQRAIQANPNSTGALAQLAEIKRDQHRLDESLRLYGEALRIDDSQPFLYLGLGDSLQRLGRYDEAEAAFRRVLELNPDSFEASYNLGVTDLNRGRLADATDWFERALALSPRHPHAAFALNNLGDIALRRGNPELAIERFRRAIASGPGHLESHYNLGTLYLEQGRLEEAVALLQQAATIQPDHELVNTGLGMAYLRLGENDPAYRSFLLVRRLYPENWIAALGLALLHAGAGQEEQARPLLQEALKLGGAAAREEAGQYPILEELLHDGGP